MARPARSPWPQRTTAVAGGMLIAGSGLLLIAYSGASIALTDRLVLDFASVPPTLAADVLTCAAFAVLAFGVRGELGVAARSPVGISALVVWGALGLLGRIAALVPVVVIDGLAVVALAAAATAAAVTARTAVLVGPARFLLVPPAAVQVLMSLAAIGPLPLELVQAASWLAPALEAVLLAVGIALLVYGRSEAVRHRIHSAYDAW